jgi:hypothetical protein
MTIEEITGMRVLAGLQQRKAALVMGLSGRETLKDIEDNVVTPTQEQMDRFGQRLKMYIASRETNNSQPEEALPA